MKKSSLYLSSFLLLQNSLFITNPVWGTENGVESTPQQNISLSDAVLIKQAIEKIKKGEWPNPRPYTLQQLQEFSTLELSSEDLDCYFFLVLSCIYINGFSYTTIPDEWFLQIKERGGKENASPRAQCNLAYCYKHGIGDEENPEQARFWIQKAAKQGFPESQFLLGLCYQEGIGGDTDLGQARIWYEKAAEQGLPQAQNNLGGYYEKGIGGDTNLGQARFWMQKAADQGFPQAQYSLGCYYQKGIGGDTDLGQARIWMQKAAEQGLPQAQNNLGICYQKGIGGETNLEQAYTWYKKAADQGLPQAQYNLGWCYQHGIGGETNLEQARFWMQKAAEQGDSEAQYNLAWYYEEGIGGDKDLVLAIDYYRKAAAQDDPQAITALRNILSFSQDKSEAEEIIEQITQVSNTLDGNIEQILGIYELNQKRNDVNNFFQEKQTASPHLHTLYQELSLYTQQGLNIVRSLNEPEFMLSSFTIPDTAVKEESKNNPLIKIYSYKDNDFITFGAENVKKADQLIEFLTNSDRAYEKYIGQLSNIIEDVLGRYTRKITYLQNNTALSQENTRDRKELEPFQEIQKITSKVQQYNTLIASDPDLQDSVLKEYIKKIIFLQDKAYLIHQAKRAQEESESEHPQRIQTIEENKNENEAIENKIQQYNTLIARHQELKEAFEETRSWQKQIEDLLRKGRIARTQVFLKDNPFFENK